MHDVETRLKCTQCGEFLTEKDLIEEEYYKPRSGANFTLVFEKIRAAEERRELRRFHRRTEIHGAGPGLIGAYTSQAVCGPVKPYAVSLQEQFVEWLLGNND